MPDYEDLILQRQELQEIYEDVDEYEEYAGCRNCQNQPAPLMMCEWGMHKMIVEPVCSGWKLKR